MLLSRAVNKQKDVAQVLVVEEGHSMAYPITFFKRNPLLFACGISILFHVGLLGGIGLIASHHSSLDFDAVPLLEAEIIDQRPQTNTYVKSVSVARPKDVSLSKKASSDQSIESPSEPTVQPINAVGTQPALTNTRGPVVDYAPPPKLPVYLRNENLKSTVVIEFLISQVGRVVPRLLSSSGNEELDALAVKTAETWKIRPALKEGKPIDSRVRLRINFEVD